MVKQVKAPENAIQHIVYSLFNEFVTAFNLNAAIDNHVVHKNLCLEAKG